MIDLVDTLPTENQYEYFKTQLLDIHQLSDYEKFDLLSKMEPMGGRKPSQLLHAMLEFYLVGMEKHLSFHYFVMQRLPQALRTQLGEVQPGDTQAHAARADKLWSVHSTAKSGTVTTFEAEEAAPGCMRTRRQVCCPLLLGKLGRQGRLNAFVPGSLVHLVDWWICFQTGLF